MKIDIQKELKSNTWENYKKSNRKNLFISIILTFLFFLIAMLNIFGMYYFLNSYVLLIPLTGAFMFFLGGCAFINNSFYYLKEINFCKYYIAWLNEHKDYLYCEGDIGDSLEECKLFK